MTGSPGDTTESDGLAARVSDEIPRVCPADASGWAAAGSHALVLADAVAALTSESAWPGLTRRPQNALVSLHDPAGSTLLARIESVS